MLDKERAGSYLGRDVQMIPHVTGEVKLQLRELAVKTQADVVFVEVGGTVGDFENAFYIEACASWPTRKGEGSVVLRGPDLHPGARGPGRAEVQGRPARHQAADGDAASMPHIIACRAEQPGQRQGPRRRSRVYTNVPMRRVFSMHDLPSIYLLPERMREAGLDSEVRAAAEPAATA